MTPHTNEIPEETGDLFSQEVMKIANILIDGWGSHDICENFHKGATTSVEANPPSEVKLAQQKRILEALKRSKEASCERLEITTGISHQSCSARLSELLRDGRIKIVGRSTTISGKPCRLYATVFVNV